MLDIEEARWEKRIYAFFLYANISNSKEGKTKGKKIIKILKQIDYLYADGSFEAPHVVPFDDEEEDEEEQQRALDEQEEQS